MIEYKTELKNTIELTPSHKNLLGNQWMILDIETTGFHREKCYINILGLILIDHEKITLSQLFNDDGKSEVELLDAFFKYIKTFNPKYIVTYNGKSFDFPFIAARARFHGLEEHVPDHLDIDLYRLVKSNKSKLNLPDYKLKTIEKYLGIDREDMISGKENIDLYFQYLNTKDDILLRKILLHNHEDMQNIMPLLGLLGKLDHENVFIQPVIKNSSGVFYLSDYRIQKDFLLITCSPFLENYYGEWVSIEDGKLKLPVVIINDMTLIDVRKIYGKSFSDYDSNTLILKSNDYWRRDNLTQHTSNLIRMILKKEL